jgi:hypothetical protein
MQQNFLGCFQARSQPGRMRHRSVMATATAIMGQAETARRMPKSNASMINSQWLSFAKKFRTESRNACDPVSVFSAPVLLMVRLIVITRMLHANRPGGSCRLRIVKSAWRSGNNAALAPFDLRLLGAMFSAKRANLIVDLVSNLSCLFHLFFE